VAVIDLAACRVNADGSDGEEVAGVNNKNFRFDTSEGDGFLPGLVAGVIGITTGETKTFELKFPDGWSNVSLDLKRSGLPESLYNGCPQLW
jgi:FKBP-type peptidyl-prolyl cis-trans isomerase (trigger factor)